MQKCSGKISKNWEIYYEYYGYYGMIILRNITEMNTDLALLEHSMFDLKQLTTFIIELPHIHLHERIFIYTNIHDGLFVLIHQVYTRTYGPSTLWKGDAITQYTVYTNTYTFTPAHVAVDSDKRKGSGWVEHAHACLL